MDWDDLRFMLAIHREKSLAGAATALGVTRTTASRRLKDAEAKLGVRLFDRTGDGFVPTAAGTDLVETAERLEAEIHVAERRILGRDAELRGPLRVSTVDFVFACSSQVFHSFVERYPGVDLTVGVTNDRVSLTRREADVALRLGSSQAEGLVGRRVARLDFAAYIARSLAKRVGRGASLSDLPWLGPDSHHEGKWFDEWLSRHAPGARIVLRSDDFTVRRHAVSAGIGAYFLACLDGDADSALVRVGPPLSAEARELWVLTLPELRNSSRVRAFMQHAAEAFREPPRARDGKRKADKT